jgi:hypothetical protein
VLALSFPGPDPERDQPPPDQSGEQLLPAPRPLMPAAERRRIKRYLARLRRFIKRYPDSYAARAARRIIRDYENRLAQFATPPKAKAKKSRRRPRQEAPP